MTAEFFEFTLRCAAAGILGLFALLLLRDRGRDQQGWFAMAVIVASGAFLITSSNVFYHEGIVDTVLRQIAALVPVALWAATLGSIHLRRDQYLLGAAAGYLVLGVLRESLELDHALLTALLIVHSLFGLALLGHGALRASRTDAGNWRFPFALAAALFGAVVIYVDPIAHKFDLPFVSEALASVTTFLFATGVAYSSLALPRSKAVAWVSPSHSVQSLQSIELPATIEVWGDNDEFAQEQRVRSSTGTKS